jgi:hypothetical protein
MKNGQTVVRLRPVAGGAYTEFSVCGVVPGSIPYSVMSSLLRGLSFWSGCPVRVVLSVDLLTASWLECWTDVFGRVPESHRKLIFKRAKR